MTATARDPRLGPAHHNAHEAAFHNAEANRLGNSAESLRQNATTLGGWRGEALAERFLREANSADKRAAAATRKAHRLWGLGL